MDKKKREALEAAGFRIGDAEDFLELTIEERRLVDLRLALSRAIHELRERQHLTQQQVAKRLRSSQSRVANIEAGSPGVSLDLMFRTYFALGGSLKDIALEAAS
jgi:DNA-binding XRE family transcriptional regulator